MRFSTLLICLSALLAGPLSLAQAPAPDSGLRRPASQTHAVTMRDGIEIELTLYHAGDGQARPTLYAAGPYPAVNELPPPAQVGNLPLFVDQGFNVVVANVRGTGRSGGQFEFLGRDEQQDHYELIEWIAAQPWSDGQVAGLGAGYYGTTQWLMALQNPPHLSCIAPVEGFINPYRDWAWQGGLANPELVRWYEHQVRESHVYRQADAPRFVEFDLRLQQLLHATEDAWWTSRAAVNSLGQIQVPVFQTGSWQTTSASWLGALQHLSRMPESMHTYISDRQDLLADTAFLENELLHYYRWCFGGQPPNGPALQPALRYQPVNGANLRASNGWPPANINYTPLFLQQASNSDSGQGRLLPDQSEPGRNSVQLGNEGHGIVVYESGRLEQAVDMTGPLVLELQLSSDAADTAIRAELFLETEQLRFPAAEPVVPSFLDPEIRPMTALSAVSRRELVSSGSVKASMREIVPSAEDERQFQYSLNNPQPLYPGRIYIVSLALAPVSWRLPADSKLVLRLTQVADASLRHSARTDSIYHTGQFASRLWLPLAADARLAFVPEATEDAQAGNVQDSIFILDSFRPGEAVIQLPGRDTPAPRPPARNSPEAVPSELP